ncbi:MAG: penicillin-binding protein 2 [Saprospiraceae bacterium]|jgi:penicillin-binding protein 2
MQQDNYKNRRYIIQGIFISVAVILLLKCFQIQILETRDGGIKKETVYASRGTITDRNGKLLVNNNAIYDIWVTYNEVAKANIDTTKLCELLNINKQQFVKNMEKNWRSNRYRKYKPFVFLRTLSPETYAQFQESLYEFPGFYVQLRNVRGYSYPIGAHVLGYIGEVSQKQIDKDKTQYYKSGDYIGVSGIELSYEEYLRGQRGVKYILKDKLGITIGSYRNGEQDTMALSGLDLVSSLDLDLQKYGELLMGNKRGSIVAIEPSTGEVLALVSTPTYDPNLLTINRNRGNAYMDLLNNKTEPLFNRAISAQYPPGSIYKPIMALVALQESVITPNRGVGCGGAYVYRGLRVGCHGHAPVSSVSRGIQHSCNAYFCQIFRETIDKNGFSNADKGLDTLGMHLKSFGMGHKLGIDLPHETTGNIPTTAYYNKIYREGAWKSPTIISLGIGQGEMLVTPLQMANLTAIIANRGWYYTPHLAKEFKNDTTQIPLKYRTKRYTTVEKRHFLPVVQGMHDVVLAGTARIAQIPGIDVCGKTGTAENPHGADHSVFIAFAPRDNPKIAIAVFVENGRYGSTHAAPIASLMIEQYLNGEIDEKRKYLEERMFNSNLLLKGLKQ